jgi:hypothetical protein
MNKEAYRKLDHEEIVTKHHYWWSWRHDKLVLLPPNHSCIGKKTEGIYIYEKVSLEDFRPLNDDEIVNKEHFYVWRNDYGNFYMYRVFRFIGHKAGYLRKELSNLPEYNIYAKKMQINFGKFDFLKEIEL